MAKRPLKVCYFGTYRANYSRNRIMIAGLRSAGVEVTECHVPLWQGIEDRVQATSGGWARWAFIKRFSRTYLRLLLRYFKLNPDYDLLLLGYPGQLDVFLARLLSWARGKPLVLDLFMSIYLIAMERNLQQRSAVTVWLLWLFETVGCRLPNLLICDTSAYRTWHQQTHGLPKVRFRLVPTGFDDRLFQPSPPPSATSDEFRVLYYGTFIPNHGVPTIIEAARRLQTDSAITFELVGEGPEHAEAQRMVATYGLQNVRFSGWLERAQLIKKIAAAHLLLGVFGVTPQSMMTIQNKIYEGLATRKPLVTATSPTIRETFQHLHHLFLVEREHPQNLAQAMLILRANPALCQRLAEVGYQKVSREFTTAALGRQFRQHLEALL